MKLITQKVEDWLALALAEVAEDYRLPIYTGEASDDTRVRPSLVVICADAQVTEPFLWRDNERTAEADIYLASPADDSIALHVERVAALEAALQDQATFSAFAADVADFYLYRYEVMATANEADNQSRSRLTRYTITVKCRDDNGDGT